MSIRRLVALASGVALVALGAVAPPAQAAPASAGLPTVNLSRPLVRASGVAAPTAVNGIPAIYSGNWSGYAALPKASGQTFTSVVGTYSVPSVDCTATPNTFSYHWIGLDGWSDGTVEQDGIAADCNGTTPYYAAWFEMYPSPLRFDFTVDPGDSIESAVAFHSDGKYELSLKDVSNGQHFDVLRTCPVASCENSSAEAITEAYYYNQRYSGTSAFGDENYANLAVSDSAGNYGGLQSPAWRTSESIALGQYGAVDTTPGPIATGQDGFVRVSAFSVFWSRKN